MKILFVFVALIYTSHASLSKERVEEEWNKFKETYRKHQFRSVGDENFRKSIFEKKLQEVENHNERYENGLESYKMGINRFSDFTEEELQPYTNGLLDFPMLSDKEEVPVTGFLDIFDRWWWWLWYNAPSSFSWKDKVTPVKNQGSCGSCWAFAAVGALEAHWNIQRGLKVSLSEQQVVDCDTRSYGCGGGWTYSALRYIIKNKGITYDSIYPYQARKGQCRYNSTWSHISIKDYVIVRQIDEEYLKTLVARKGPVAVAIDARGSFGSYSSGVYYNPSCKTRSANHAVLLVGYGSENGKDYWLVKNSWGADWGDGGYIKMARNRNNNCGIADEIEYPVL